MLLDSNIWIYLLDPAAPENPSVVSWFARTGATEELLVPTIVQLEVLHVMRRFAGDDFETAANRFLEQDDEPLALTTREVRYVAEKYGIDRMMKIGSRDAALLAYAHDHQATLATHDRFLGRLAESEGVPVVDPVTATA